MPSSSMPALILFRTWSNAVPEMTLRPAEASSGPTGGALEEDGDLIARSWLEQRLAEQLLGIGNTSGTDAFRRCVDVVFGAAKVWNACIEKEPERSGAALVGEASGASVQPTVRAHHPVKLVVYMAADDDGLADAAQDLLNDFVWGEH